MGGWMGGWVGADIVFSSVFFIFRYIDKNNILVINILSKFVNVFEIKSYDQL